MEGKMNKVSQFFVKKLSKDAICPTRGTCKSAGYDLYSIQSKKVPSRGKQMIKTGLAFKIPENTYARIAPRSGLAWKHSIDVGAGVIDQDYRGEVCVILFNHSQNDFEVNKGDRIAQVIIEKIEPTDIFAVEDLDQTQRGVAGFGSTGISQKKQNQAPLKEIK